MRSIPRLNLYSLGCPLKSRFTRRSGSLPSGIIEHPGVVGHAGRPCHPSPFERYLIVAAGRSMTYAEPSMLGSHYHPSAA
jgi:hypothetical protein